MITQDDIAAWVQANAAALSREEDIDEDTTKRYHSPTTSEQARDLLALRACDERAGRAGFAPVYQIGGQFHSSYGPILIRVFLKHLSPTQWEITFTAKDGPGLSQIIEVAEYLVEEKDQVGITPREYFCAQTYFNAAGLVLPKH
jgi:hypothetical protein